MQKIVSEQDLIAMLSAAPSETLVDGDSFEEIYVVRRGDVLAEVAEGSPAADLLYRASQADIDGDLATWQALPLRYGPWCGTWCYLSHPLAPAAPGAMAE
jgi:hypothetical protein